MAPCQRARATRQAQPSQGARVSDRGVILCPSIQGSSGRPIQIKAHVQHLSQAAQMGEGVIQTSTAPIASDDQRLRQGWCLVPPEDP